MCEQSELINALRTDAIADGKYVHIIETIVDQRIRFCGAFPLACVHAQNKTPKSLGLNIP